MKITKYAQINKNYHTIIILNFPFNVDPNFIIPIYSQHGEIFKFISLYCKGMHFCTFYNIKSAHNALRKMNKTNFYGRLL